MATSHTKISIVNEDIQNTLKGLGIDIDKFWFLLLFI